MKRVFALFSTFIISFTVFGQDIEGIRQSVKNDPELYASVLELFQNDCGKVKEEYYPYLYYGFAFTPQYRGNFDLFREMYAALKSGDREKALQEALKCEVQNPVCLELLYQLASLTSGTPKEEDYFNRFRMMILTVLASGDGRTPQTAYKVIRTGDEYKVLSIVYKMGDLTSQFSLDGGIDQMNIVTRSGEEMTVYFDRSLPTVWDAEYLKAF